MNRSYALILLSTLCIPMISYAEEIFDIDPALYQWCQEVRDIPAQPYDAFINLGDNCQIAYQMRLHGIRNEALPFDWIRTPFESLRKILEDQFEHFLAVENLVFVVAEKENYIFDTYYGIQFLHDFKLEENFLANYDTVKATYTRRIERFLRILKNSRRALFIRKKMNKKQAIELRSLLQKLCPENDFLILVVDNTNEIKNDWHLDHIKNMYLRPPQPASWKGDPKAWEEIFMALDLHLSPTNETIPTFKQ